MAKTKSPNGSCSTPVKDQGTYNHADKTQGAQPCAIDNPSNTATPIKKGKGSLSPQNFGKRSQSSSPKQQDSISRRSSRTGASQEVLCPTDIIPEKVTVSPKSSQKNKPQLTASRNSSPRPRSRTNSPRPRSRTNSPKPASKNVSLIATTDNCSLAEDKLEAELHTNWASTGDEDSRIFVYQNVKHAISGLPCGARTPIVCIQDVRDELAEDSLKESAKVENKRDLIGAKAPSSAALESSELRKHLLISFSQPAVSKKLDMEIVPSSKKKGYSKKSGKNSSPSKLEKSQDTMKDVNVKMNKTKNTKSPGKPKLEKNEKKKVSTKKEFAIMLDEGPSLQDGKHFADKERECRPKVSRKKSILDISLPHDTSSTEIKMSSDGRSVRTKLCNDSSPSKEVKLNNGDQYSDDVLCKSSEDMSRNSLSTSPTPPKEGDTVRHGRRIRSPSMRYADDMILFPLKSPRKSPKPGSAKEGESPEEKHTKTAECQTSELYALLTRSNDKIITPTKRKSPSGGNDTGGKTQARLGKHSGVVREIDFSEGVKNNTRDSQIQVQMEEHLAKVHKEELTRFKNKFSSDTDSSGIVTKPCTSKLGIACCDEKESQTISNDMGSDIHSKADPNLGTEKSCLNMECDNTDMSYGPVDSNKQDNINVQKSKSANLFTLISRVKSNLESFSPLPHFLSSGGSNSVMSGDEEDLEEEKDFEKDFLCNVSTDQPENTVKQNTCSYSEEVTSEKVVKSNNCEERVRGDQSVVDAETEAASDKMKEHQCKLSKEIHKPEHLIQKTTQHINTLEGLLSSTPACEEGTTHISSEKGSAKQLWTSINQECVSPEKKPIYPADVILVDSATSSSDDLKSKSCVQKTDEVDTEQTAVVSSTDCDSTTDDSPARKNIFDLLMSDYQPTNDQTECDAGESVEREADEGERSGNLQKVNAQQETSTSMGEKVTINDNTKLQKLSILEEIQKKLNPNESIKNSKTPTKINSKATVDLACTETIIGETVSEKCVTDKSSSTGQSSTTPGKLMTKSELGRKTIREPLPLDILKSVEMEITDKMTAFQSKTLDDYLWKMKHGTEEKRTMEKNMEEGEDDNQEFEEELEPDFDEIDGMVFVSFSSEETLAAHVEVERKTNIGKNDNLLLGMSRLKNLRKKRERIQSKYHKRIQRLKSLKVHGQMNQNLRGMHKALEKYQKLYRKELYGILKSKNMQVTFKSPQKTSDITKIKGWKKKFGNTEKLAEAAGLPISQTGKLHWRTEARLLKNLKPDELKEIGLNLKKKRRKNLVFTIRKGMSKGDNSRPERGEDDAAEKGDDQDDVDENSDNESVEEEEEDENENQDDSLFDDYNISSEQKKKSQYKIKQERLQKRLMLQSLSFGPEEESIIRKLGGQRALRKSNFGPDYTPQPADDIVKGKRGRKKKGEVVSLTTLTEDMALSALSTLDPRFIKEKPKPPPPPIPPPLPHSLIQNTLVPVPKLKSTKEEFLSSDRLGIKESKSCDDDPDWEPNETMSRERRAKGKSKKKVVTNTVKVEDTVQCDQPGCTTTSTTHTPTTKSRAEHPGCRYGCICHLCKFAEAGPDNEHRLHQTTKCDKEYCRLGCICDSIGARGIADNHCHMPQCLSGCVCPLKQVKEENLSGEINQSGNGNDDEEKATKLKGNLKKNENLPRRKPTYRLAKNLDAISRKAMLLYETSEMYCTEQKKRRSKELDEAANGQQKNGTISSSPSQLDSKSQVDNNMNHFVIYGGQIKPPNGTTVTEAPRSKPGPKSSRPYPRLDIPEVKLQNSNMKAKTSSNKKNSKAGGSVRRTEFDDITFDEMLESDTDDYGDYTSCARTVVYNPLHSRNKHRCTCQNEAHHQTTKSKEMGDCSSPIVISPGNSCPSSPITDRSKQSDVPTSQNRPRTAPPSDQTVATNKPGIPGLMKAYQTGWHTQWVCLKTSKKMPGEEESFEIRLLEMISNCNWESAKQKILSKISNQISRERVPKPKQMFVGDFLISFLPPSDKPAVIPPEVKAKLPRYIFSIRVKVVNINNKSNDLMAKTRNLGEFISAQEKILTKSKPLENTPHNTTKTQPVSSGAGVTKDTVIPFLVATESSQLPSSQASPCLPSGGISGLSRLQINRHTTPSTIKLMGPAVTAGKMVTSPSKKSLLSPVSLSVATSQQAGDIVRSVAVAGPRMSTGMLTAGTPLSVGGCLQNAAGQNNLVILQDPTGSTKYVLASPVSQSGQALRLVPTTATSSKQVVSKNLKADNVTSKHCESSASPSLPVTQNVLPGKSTSHSTVTTSTVPVTVTSATGLVTTVTMTTVVSPLTVTSNKLTTAQSGKMLKKSSTNPVFPPDGLPVIASVAGLNIMSKLVPIVPKPIKPSPTPTPTSINEVPIVPKPNPTVTQEVIILSAPIPVAQSQPSIVSSVPFNISSTSVYSKPKKKKPEPVKKLEESELMMRLGPSDNKMLVTKKAVEKGSAVFHKFRLSRPKGKEEVEEDKGEEDPDQPPRKKKKKKKDEVSEEGVNNEEEKKKKKRKKKKKLNPDESKDKPSNDTEGGQTKKKKKKKREASVLESNKNDGLNNNTDCNNDDLAQKEPTSSPPAKKSKKEDHNDNTSPHPSAGQNLHSVILNQIETTLKEYEMEEKNESANDLKSSNTEGTRENDSKVSELMDEVDGTEVKTLADNQALSHADVKSSSGSCVVKSAPNDSNEEVLSDPKENVQVLETHPERLQNEDNFEIDTESSEGTIQSCNTSQNSLNNLKILETVQKASEDILHIIEGSKNPLKANPHLSPIGDVSKDINCATVHSNGLKEKLQGAEHPVGLEKPVEGSGKDCPGSKLSSEGNDVVVSAEILSEELKSSVQILDASGKEKESHTQVEDENPLMPVEAEDGNPLMPVELSSDDEEEIKEVVHSMSEKAADSRVTEQRNRSQDVTETLDGSSHKGDRMVEDSLGKLVGKSLEIVNSIRHCIDLSQDKIRESKQQKSDVSGDKNTSGEDINVKPVPSTVTDPLCDSTHMEKDTVVIDLSDEETCNEKEASEQSSTKASIIDVEQSSTKASIINVEQSSTKASVINVEQSCTKASMIDVEQSSTKASVIDVEQSSSAKDRELKGSTVHGKVTKTQPDTPVIIIDDEDKTDTEKQENVVQDSTQTKSLQKMCTTNSPSVMDSNNIDIETVSEDEDSDVDIEEVSSTRSGASELQSQLAQVTQRPSKPPTSCLIHSHKGKRKAAMGTIDNLDDVEFQEGLVKTSIPSGKNGKSGRSSILQVTHQIREKQRRKDLKTGFKDLIEVIFGQDESGKKKPMSVEAIQGVSKIKVLHMALTMIQEAERSQVETECKLQALQIQNAGLRAKLTDVKKTLISGGMSPVRMQEILSKISKTCKFIFAKREMIMKKRLNTLKAAMETCAKSETAAEDKAKTSADDCQNTPIQMSTVGKMVCGVAPSPVPKAVLNDSYQAVSYTAVPVQLVSSAQVMQMAQCNRVKSDRPEIYIDMAEDREVSIKQEKGSDGGYVSEPSSQLKIVKAWSQQEEKVNPVGSESVTDKVKQEKDNTVENDVDEAELERMNTQSPVFSDVDMSEDFFVRQHEDMEETQEDSEPLNSSKNSSDLEYKVIDNSNHSEVMVLKIPEENNTPQEDS